MEGGPDGGLSRRCPPHYEEGGRGDEVDCRLSDRPVRQKTAQRFLPAAWGGFAICRYSRARISGPAEEAAPNRVRESTETYRRRDVQYLVRGLRGPGVKVVRAG